MPCITNLEKGKCSDFCHAIDDIKNQNFKTIGRSSKLRFEEDPVRMLAYITFCCEVKFLSIDQLKYLDVFTQEMTQLLRDVSPHRLYDESQKLFTMGHLHRVMPMLIDFGIWKQLFADIQPNITPFIERAAKNTDQRIQVGKTINPAFFYAVLLWKPFLERCEFYSM
jgi:poly(A) polymerase